MHQFDNITILADQLSEKIAQQLAEAIEKKGHALLAVSGGSTPKPLFVKLSNINIAWQNVWVVLVDERWVNANNPDSNEYLVRHSLLKNRAKAAHFMPLKSFHESASQAQVTCNYSLQVLPENIDVLLLGMGEDGHIASMFPCADLCMLKKILDNKNPLRVMAIQPNTAPHERMSLTASYLLKSKNRYLLLKGENKLSIYKKALAGEDIFSMPVRLFTHKTDIELEVYFSP